MAGEREHYITIHGFAVAAGDGVSLAFIEALISAGVLNPVKPDGRRRYLALEDIAVVTTFREESVVRAREALDHAATLAELRREERHRRLPRDLDLAVASFLGVGDEDAMRQRWAQLVPKLRAASRAAISSSVRRAVIERDGGRCYYCGRRFVGKHTGRRPHIDHLTPVRWGGTEELDNLVAACRDCNLEKKDAPTEVCVRCGRHEFRSTGAKLCRHCAGDLYREFLDQIDRKGKVVRPDPFGINEMDPDGNFGLAALARLAVEHPGDDHEDDEGDLVETPSSGEGGPSSGESTQLQPEEGR
jgi:hypothetical protein